MEDAHGAHDVGAHGERRALALNAYAETVSWRGQVFRKRIPLSEATTAPQGLLVRRVAAEEWLSVASGFDDFTFEQSLTYSADAAARIGARAEYFAVERGSEIVAAAAVRVKRLPGLGFGIAYVASGPMMLRSGKPVPLPGEILDIVDAFRDELVRKARHVFRFRLAARVEYDDSAIADRLTGAGYAPTATVPSYETALVMLDKTDDELMASFHGKWRSSLRKSFRTGLTVESGPIAEMRERFETLYRYVREQKGYETPVEPKAFYDLAGPDFEHVALFAVMDGEDVAAISVGTSGTTSVYLFGGTAPKGRESNAGNFLTWEGYRYARDRGCAIYDLGGIDEAKNPKGATFKLRAGSTRVVAAGPFEARPTGLAGRVTIGAETLFRRIRSRK